MPNSADRLRNIKTFKQLVRYLEDELDWPLEEYGFDELTFEYSPAELGLKEEDADKVKIYQLRPIYNGQPWGIFFVEFQKKRMPVVVLRRILSHLVLKKRASANKAQAAAWNLDDLLFISAFGEQASDQREIAFAHFHQEKGDLPTLRVLGWDGADTALKLEHVDATLHERLRWPSNQADVDAWRQQWSRAFRHRIGHVIRTADALAEVLAALARGIRDAARTLMDHESERGQLRKLHKAFQTALIHDLTEESFADTYAQTITYGLLTAAISRTEMSEGRHGTALVAENVTDMVPITNPFLREMLETFIQAGGRKGGIDFDELGIQDVVELLRGGETDLPAILRDFGNRTRGEDPVIHFYEHFLKAYNKQLKIQRGVFYTPQPVVFHIVRSVHELLQTEFGLEDGLASTITWGEMAMRNPDMKIPDGVEPDSPFVMVLDPATGTATFLVEVIDVIYHTVMNKWKKAGMSSEQQRTAWNDYVPHNLLPRLYGYELMMAPYAIAHMKIGLKLFETGYTFSSAERVRIYLTNALEPESDIQHKLAGVVPALAHEARDVNDVKRHKRFTVIVGNPPYSARSYNLTDTARALIEPYKFINGAKIIEKGALQFEKNLNDDYVKFLRLAQLLTGGIPAVVGMITNHSFLENPTLRGLRWSLLQQYKLTFFLDLGGNVARKEKAQDENVFDISQGVAISLLASSPKSRKAAIVNVSRLKGSREEKYDRLSKQEAISSIYSTATPAEPFYLFRIEDINLRNEYDAGIGVAELFPLNSTGVKTHRDHFCIDFSLKPLHKRIADLISTDKSDAQIRDLYQIPDTYGWTLSRCRLRLRDEKDWESSFDQILYRPFDWRSIYFSSHVVELARMEVSRHFLHRENIGFIFMRQVASDETYSHFGVTRSPVDNRAFYSNRGTMSFAPLYCYESSDSLFNGTTSGDPHPNLDQKCLHRIELKFSDSGKYHPRPEDIFHYAYAVFHSPTYRTRYADFLKIDFPRLPLTSKVDLFKKMTNLGAELVSLHLMESPKLTRLITKFVGNKNQEVEKVSYSDDTVWIDKSKTCGFSGVSLPNWNFRFGGYQVCEKWLKDRKEQKLTSKDIDHYHRIVVVLNETIKLMSKIDEVIDQYGGWPLK